MCLAGMYCRTKAGRLVDDLLLGGRENVWRQHAAQDEEINTPKHLQRAAADFFFWFLMTGSGANREGGAEAWAGWESEAHGGFNGTRFLGTGPANLAIGTRN